jgi:hypothetical protein
MENTPRWISDVQAALAGVDVHAIGFGTDANIDGMRLTDLVSGHNGLYTRAESGIALEKFFSHAFGNIFETGILMDPELDVAADQDGVPQSFTACGEQALTVVIGWDRTDGELLAELRTPSGATIPVGAPETEYAVGRTWSFLRVPLPMGGERDGSWTVRAVRPGGGGEFPPAKPALRYFVNVIPTGGARLVRAPVTTRYYTGDRINPLVYLRYNDGSWPRGGKVQLNVSRPAAAVGEILSRERLRPPVTMNGDTIPARQATLTSLEQASGKPLITYSEDAFDLSEESADTEGAFEPSGLFGKSLKDLLRFEGNYTFHYVAAYGEACTGTRELLWSVHVDTSVDPGRTDVTITTTGKLPDGKHTGTVLIVPRDCYSSQLGPGRAGDLSVSGASGTTVTGPMQDNGDGSYTVPLAWEPGAADGPGLVIGQPERTPIVVTGPKAARGQCRTWRLLFWLLLFVTLVLLVLLLLAWLS